MFTRLFYVSLASRLNNCSNTQITLKEARGNTTTLKNSFPYPMGNFYTSVSKLIYLGKTSTSWSEGVAFGDGNTPPSLDDYQLAGEHFTTYSASYVTQLSHDDDGATATVIYSLTNSGSTAFTIREVGVFTGGYGMTCLMYREVLDTPVTIEPGGIGQVTITFRVNYPT